MYLGSCGPEQRRVCEKYHFLSFHLIFLERGTLTADRYIRQCLQNHVVPYAPFVGEHFLFMHDNSRPHAARIVAGYLNTVEIPVMEWPARSPDMNPIEHLWDKLGRKVTKRQPLPETIPELRTALSEEWEQMMQETIQHLIESMRRQRNRD